MKSVLAVLTVLLAGGCLVTAARAADEPGKLSIYAQPGPASHGFEPRPLTEREQELIYQILEAGADFHARYVPDFVTGKVEVLNQVGAKFGYFSVISDSPEISREVRPLCDELGLPLGLLLRTNPATGGAQITAWQGCRQVRLLHLMHPHIKSADLQGLAEYPALENLYLGTGSLISRSFTLIDHGYPYRGEVPDISDEVVAMLARIETLRRVLIFGCPVTATNLDRMHNVRTVLIHNSELTPETLASLGRLPRIEELNLTGSVVTEEMHVDWSGLRLARTISLPHLPVPLEQSLRLLTGLDQLPDLEVLSFSRLHGEDWPDLTIIPDQVQRVEFYDVVLDGVSDLGFADARLQAHRVQLQRQADRGQFVLTEMQDSRDPTQRGCRIAGRQVAAIRVGAQEYEPTEFRIVRFSDWTVEAGFAHNAMTLTPEYPDFARLQNEAVQRLARLGLLILPEFGGGGGFVGPLAKVCLGWREPLPLPSDASHAVDQLIAIPLEKLVITTEQFPLDRLAELGKIKSLKSFELKRDGLSDEHLQVIQSWDQLEELSITSPDNTFTKEALDKLAEAFPECDLLITDGGPGGQPLLFRKKPRGQPAGPKISF